MLDINKIKARKYKGKFLKGAAMITLDHNMHNHKILNDYKALESDWEKVQLDMLSAWKDATVAK